MFPQPVIEFIPKGKNRGGDSADVADRKTAFSVPPLHGARATAEIPGNILPTVQPNRCGESVRFRIHLDSSVPSCAGQAIQ